jgi:ABC-type transporter Mla subunit MlaD
MAGLITSLFRPRGLAILACYAIVLGLLVLAAEIRPSLPLFALVAALAAPSILLWAAVERLSAQSQAGVDALKARIEASSTAQDHAGWALCGLHDKTEAMLGQLARLDEARGGAAWALEGLHDKTERANQQINQLFGDVVTFDRWCRSLQDRIDQISAAQAECIDAVRGSADLIMTLRSTVIEIGEAAERLQDGLDARLGEQDNTVKKLSALLSLAEDNIAAIGANVEAALRASGQR